MTARVSYINPPGAPPAGMYSHAAVCTPGRLAFIAGQTASDPSGAPVSPIDVVGQVPAMFDNLERVLKRLGASIGDIAQLATYLGGIDKRDACRPDFLLEIAAIARIPD